MDMNAMLEKMVEWLITTGLDIGLILLGATVLLFLLRKINGGLFDRYLENRSEKFRKRADTLRSVIMHLITVSVVLITLLVILGQVGINIGPILAAAGIMGVAVGVFLGVFVAVT